MESFRLIVKSITQFSLSPPEPDLKGNYSQILTHGLKTLPQTYNVRTT